MVSQLENRHNDKKDTKNNGGQGWRGLLINASFGYNDIEFDTFTDGQMDPGIARKAT